MRQAKDRSPKMLPTTSNLKHLLSINHIAVLSLKYSVVKSEHQASLCQNKYVTLGANGNKPIHMDAKFKFNNLTNSQLSQALAYFQ